MSSRYRSHCRPGTGAASGKCQPGSRSHSGKHEPEFHTNLSVAIMGFLWDDWPSKSGQICQKSTPTWCAPPDSNPGTCGLRIRCSTVELGAPGQYNAPQVVNATMTVARPGSLAALHAADRPGGSGHRWRAVGRHMVGRRGQPEPPRQPRQRVLEGCAQKAKEWSPAAGSHRPASRSSGPGRSAVGPPPGAGGPLAGGEPAGQAGYRLPVSRATGLWAS